MEKDLIMNSEPHPKDNNVIAVGIGHSIHLLKVKREGNTSIIGSCN